jgi:hypothetical protein
VIRVDVLVENRDTRDRLDGLRNACDGFNLAAFAEVWYTLNKTISDF